MSQPNSGRVKIWSVIRVWFRSKTDWPVFLPCISCKWKFEPGSDLTNSDSVRSTGIWFGSCSDLLNSGSVCRIRIGSNSGCPEPNLTQPSPFARANMHRSFFFPDYKETLPLFFLTCSVVLHHEYPAKPFVLTCYEHLWSLHKRSAN